MSEDSQDNSLPEGEPATDETDERPEHSNDLPQGETPEEGYEEPEPLPGDEEVGPDGEVDEETDEDDEDDEDLEDEDEDEESESGGKKTGQRVPEGTVEEVKAWVKKNPDRARKALERENESDSPRSTLTSYLESVLAKSDDEE